MRDGGGGAPAQADICQLGLDQRKVNMLAREYCDDIKRKWKPVILSHRMMPGLLEVGDACAGLLPQPQARCVHGQRTSALHRHVVE